MGRVGCDMSKEKPNKYIVVTVYDEYETGIVFCSTLKLARADYKRQIEAGYNAYLAKVMK